jgi:phage replication-related protein YjqB (UPF0714/DUF867 family)
MTSPYRNFQDLKAREVEGKNYRIRTYLRNSPVLVMAPHGGKIEPGTTEIAEAIADMDHSFYSFEGLMSEGNNVFHIESHHYDEPRALEAVDKADIVITIHGQVDQKDEFVMVGGLHTRLCSDIKRQLEASGFRTRPPTKGLSGTDPRNICNQGISKGGVQLEISRKVRDSLRTTPDRLQTFADAVRRAIKQYTIVEAPRPRVGLPD